ncbi:hypothetical protein PPACK8108_LOCUS1180 [Phakopsora pachyrhizi]|uniref:Uncharacterized protein n=1 Tax=Phakopsora pachyrhizi TaxID=170000 RepID=A0AAV0AID8_PHAPC|nr:hypothetical protein PPACK8108_LOCUS1180 [Phakopsora pachyrhizi]
MKLFSGAINSLGTNSGSLSKCFKRISNNETSLVNTVTSITCDLEKGIKPKTDNVLETFNFCGTPTITITTAAEMSEDSEKMEMFLEESSSRSSISAAVALVIARIPRQLNASKTLSVFCQTPSTKSLVIEAQVFSRPLVLLDFISKDIMKSLEHLKYSINEH